MFELILLTIIVIIVIGFSAFQFYMNHKHIQKLEGMLMSGNIRKESKGVKPVGDPNQLKSEPNELTLQGMGEFDISKVNNLQIDGLPSRKVKIYK